MSDFTLPVGLDTLRFLIDKAHEFQAKEAVTIPETPLSPSDDWGQQVLADHKDDPCLLEFCDAIDDLEPDQQAGVVALMWIGRGDYDASEWAEACQDASEQKTTSTGVYLISTPLASDYIEEGLAKFNFSCNDLDD